MTDRRRLRTHTARLAVPAGLVLIAMILIVSVVAAGRAEGAARATSEAVGSYGAVQVAITPQSVQLDIAKGITQTVVLSTAPNAHLAYSINFSGSKSSITGTTKANSHG